MWIYIYIYPPPCPQGTSGVSIRFSSLRRSDLWIFVGDPPPRAKISAHPYITLHDFFRAFFLSFFFLRFWAPISPKRCPKASIVQILEPKRLHFGSHFGALFGPAAKVKIELPSRREPS